MNRPLVVGVGFHKTGTTSLGLALDQLGYRVCGHTPSLADSLSAGRVHEAIDHARGFDALQDNPWPLLFRELDVEFPEAKFILTVRDPDAWLASVTKHFGGQTTAMRAWIYPTGDPEEDPAAYLRVYSEHVLAVRQHFADRADKFLELDWSEGAGWGELCDFLGHEVPSSPFPHANAAQPRWVRRLKRGALWARVR